MRCYYSVCSLPMLLSDFLFAEPEKASSVVVENVTLLLRDQERRIFDGHYCVSSNAEIEPPPAQSRSSVDLKLFNQLGKTVDDISLRFCTPL
jgi:hypothetical protein